MRIFCVILSLVVFSLSTVPCCSDDYCNDEITAEHSGDHPHDDKESNCNTCSPFFACGTCSGFMFSESIPQFEILYIIKDKLATVYKVHFVSDFFAKIWQPPQIS